MRKTRVKVAKFSIPAEEKTEQLRDEKGRLLPGTTGNPGGRPKWVKHVQQELEVCTKYGLKLLFGVINGDPFEEDINGEQVLRTPRLADRLRAVEIAMAYTLIKPTQKVDLVVSSAPAWIAETTKEEALKILKDAAEEGVTVDAEPSESE